MIRQEGQDKEGCIVLVDPTQSSANSSPGRTVAAAPKTPDKPLNSFNSRAEQQPSSNKRKECLQNRIEFLVLSGRHLPSILNLALLAEDGAPKLGEPCVQKTQFLKPFVAYLINRIEVLRPSDFLVEYQRLRMRDLLRLEIKRVRRVCRNLRQLRGERGSHVDGW